MRSKVGGAFPRAPTTAAPRQAAAEPKMYAEAQMHAHRATTAVSAPPVPTRPHPHDENADRDDTSFSADDAHAAFGPRFPSRVIFLSPARLLQYSALPLALCVTRYVHAPPAAQSLLSIVALQSEEGTPFFHLCTSRGPIHGWKATQCKKVAELEC